MSEDRTVKMAVAKILIIDDDEAIRDTLKAVLFKTGHSLFTAEDGETGLAMVKSCNPDLILLDIMMPRMDGFEFCRLLRQDPCFSEIPVIMITALDDREAKLEGLEAGADDFISKPWDKAELLARVKTTVTLNRYRKLLEERKKFDQVIQLVPDPITIIDEQGQLLFVNTAFMELFSLDATVGFEQRNMVECLPSELQDYAVWKNQTTGSGQKDDDSRLILCEDDARGSVWLSLRSVFVEVEAKPALLLTVYDATKDVLAQQALKRDNEEMIQENLKLRAAIKDQFHFGEIIGDSEPVQEVFELIVKASVSKAPIVLLGESGTGKELAAQAIHRLGCQDGKPLVPVNCGAIAESLFESEFFGYKKGAFTDAKADKKGFLHEANGGTLFLDEIAEISLAGQTKLLRVIENGMYTPVGDTKQVKSRFRLIAATNRNLQEHVAKGLMREDFFYRINVIPIAIPALRDRREDIPLLCEHFLKLYNSDKKLPAISRQSMDMLSNYAWPGNVRELQSAIQRFLVFGNFNFMKSSALSSVEMVDLQGVCVSDVTSLSAAMFSYEEYVIRASLDRNRWQRGVTANDLDVNPKTLYKKMKKFGLG